MSVTVHGRRRTVADMEVTEWAMRTARQHLERPLPRRWAHTQGVAAAARTLAPLLGEDAGLLEAAAWLHDIGYAPTIVHTGMHHLDGARYLRDVEHADPMLCRLVAHHSCAVVEAEERGLAEELLREFEPAPGLLAGALIYCDMTTTPDGLPVAVDERLTEILDRYGPGDLVHRAISRSAPQIKAAVTTITRKLCRYRRGQGTPACV